MLILASNLARSTPQALYRVGPRQLTGWDPVKTGWVRFVCPDCQGHVDGENGDQVDLDDVEKLNTTRIGR